MQNFNVVTTCEFSIKKNSVDFFQGSNIYKLLKKKDKFNFFVTSIPLRTGTIFPVDREISPIKIDNFRIKLELCKTSIFCDVHSCIRA